MSDEAAMIVETPRPSPWPARLRALTVGAIAGLSVIALALPSGRSRVYSVLIRVLRGRPQELLADRLDALGPAGWPELAQLCDRRDWLDPAREVVARRLRGRLQRQDVPQLLDAARAAQDLGRATFTRLAVDAWDGAEWPRPPAGYVTGEERLRWRTRGVDEALILATLEALDAFEPPIRWRSFGGIDRARLRWRLEALLSPGRLSSSLLRDFWSDNPELHWAACEQLPGIVALRRQQLVAHGLTAEEIQRRWCLGSLEPLGGEADRASIIDRLVSEALEDERGSAAEALFVIGLDGLRAFNDALESRDEWPRFRITDAALETLRDCEGDLKARFERDRFIALSARALEDSRPSAWPREELRKLAHRIVRALEQEDGHHPACAPLNLALVLSMDLRVGTSGEDAE